MGPKLYCVSYIFYVHINIKDCRSMLGNNSCNVLSLRSSLHKPHFTHYHTLMWKTEKRTKELKRVVPKPGHGPLQPPFRIMEIAKTANLFSAPGKRKKFKQQQSKFLFRYDSWGIKAKAVHQITFYTDARPGLYHSKCTDWLRDSKPKLINTKPINLRDIGTWCPRYQQD